MFPSTLVVTQATQYTAIAITRLPPVVYDFRAADTVGHSRVKAIRVWLYDTTPVQVLSPEYRHAGLLARTLSMV